MVEGEEQKKKEYKENKVSVTEQEIKRWVGRYGI